MGIPVTFACVLLFMEISTHFVAARWLMFEHGIAGFVQNVNSLCLFLTFIVGRVFFQLYCCIFYGLPFAYNTFFVQEDVPKAYLFVLVLFTISICINVALNLFWSYLIIK